MISSEKKLILKMKQMTKIENLAKGKKKKNSRI